MEILQYDCQFFKVHVVCNVIFFNLIFPPLSLHDKKGESTSLCRQSQGLSYEAKYSA